MWTAVLSLLAIVLIGLLNLRNAAEYASESFHQTQVLWVVIGLLVAMAVSVLDLRFFERLAPVFYWGAVLFLLLVLFFGRESHNARRWFDLGDIAFQPSEFAKPALVLFLARYFHGERNPERYTLRKLLKPMAYMGLPAVMILLEPDLGTTLVLISVGFSIMFFEGMRMRSFLKLLGIIAVVVPLAWHFNVIKPYQKERVSVWLDMARSGPDGHKKKNLGKGMQPEQALWAVGSGRLLGKGGLQGVQSRLKYLPEMHTDFIIATYAEERGFVGCVFLLMLYLGLVVSLLMVAVKARERFAVLVSVGAVAIILWQMVFNIGMVLGLLPVVGLTLPFMSYGGSATISAMFAVGLALNAGIHKGQV
ncbi:MAG: rod shape-determining protein RodA [Deltaproteobacteria bacterium]|nr:rod shape-determining protein RodA [Deltaproteobacteria bacterium]